MLNVPLVFLDTETTGLSYDKQVWDVAMIRDNPNGTTERDEFQLRVLEDDTELYEFSEEAKKYNHWERYDPENAIGSVEAIKRISHMFRDRAHLVGMVPDFDANALWRLIREGQPNGPNERATYPWYYQIIDVDMIALGYFQRAMIDEKRRGTYIFNGDEAYTGLATLPIDTDKVSDWFSVKKPSDSERHTAMGDAEWTRNIYYALAGLTPPA